MGVAELTPTQELIMDTLAARYRAGETLWTFSSRVAKQVEELAQFGLVVAMSGITEGTVRALLTDEGKSRWLTAAFDPPTRKRIQVTVEVDTDDINDVLAFYSNDFYPKHSITEKWLGLAQIASHADDQTHFDQVIAGMPSGLAWSYLKSREPGGIEELRALLALAEP